MVEARVRSRGLSLLHLLTLLVLCIAGCSSAQTNNGRAVFVFDRSKSGGSPSDYFHASKRCPVFIEGKKWYTYIEASLIDGVLRDSSATPLGGKQSCSVCMPGTVVLSGKVEEAPEREKVEAKEPLQREPARVQTPSPQVWLPSESDLVRLGAALNRSVGATKPIVKLLVDAAEWRSIPHANFAESVYRVFDGAREISEAHDIVARWPEGRSKEAARATIVAYAKVHFGTAQAIGQAKAMDYEKCGATLQRIGEDMSSNVEAMTRLWTSTSVKDWEFSLGQLTLIVDVGTRIAHRPRCEALEERRSSALKETGKRIQQAWDRLESGPLAKDQRKGKEVLEWARKPQGSRGPCPVDLPEQLKRDCLPNWIAEYIPVSVDRRNAYAACRSCMP